MDARVRQITETNLENLHVLLRGIENAEIRVPTFQRGFIWTKRQITDFLSSVYEGYPIGSIILWNTSNKSIGPKSDASVPFPASRLHYPVTYIIDGVQRLCTLYGVLGYRMDQGPNPKFAVAFDLVGRVFRHITRREPTKSDEINLSVLFSPRLFVETQAAFFNRQDGELLVQRAMEIHDVFAGYQVPVVRILGNRELSEVFEIFIRLNTEGTRLTKSQLDEPYRQRLESGNSRLSKFDS